MTFNGNGNLTGSAQYFNDKVFYNGVATQSLRRNDDDSAYLYRTPSSASNRKTYTFSCWYKRANLSGVNQPFFYAGSSGSDFTLFYIDGGSNRLSWYDYDGSTDYGQNLSIPLRDTTAWYHLVFAVDTTQGTDTNRVKIYVNGTLQTSVGAGYGLFPQDYDTRINDTKPHWLGRYNADYIDGYMAEVNFVDGTQLAPTSFGETKNGVWIPKEYTGSYGTNGFRLQFDQVGVGTASTSTIGADTSGNTHHFTSSGIVASDCNMPDSPENNFCTLNGVAKSSSLTLSEGNLQTNTDNKFALGTIGVNSGKWYYENYINSTNGGFAGVYESDSGVYSTTIDDGGNNPDGYGIYSNGQKVRNSSYANYGSAFTTAGDIIGVALDMDNGAIYFSKNGTWQNSATTSEIAAGTTTNAAYTGLSGNMVARVGHYNNNNPTIVNFGQDASFAGSLTGSNIGDETPDEGAGVFKYAPPSGFLALCTANLPEPTIGPNSATQADNYFGTLTWSGDDGATRKIATSESGVTGTVDFTPDWSWIKRRNGDTNGSDHLLLDIVRGVDAFNGLSTNGTSQEGQTEAGSTWTNFGDINNFENGGFTVQKGTDVSHTLEGINQSGGTYVGWNWKAGGSSSSNAGGSIASNVSANTKAGFSIVTYTGTGANATVGHGIGIAPRMIIIKRRDAAQNWVVYHEEIGNDRELLLNVGNAQTNTGSTYFQSTSPTTSVFSLGSDNYANASSGTYVAYCFAEIEGYSKINKYNPNNTTDSAFVYTGFKPAMVLLKGAEISNQEWCILDNKRPGYNNVYNLNPNYKNVETTSNTVDFLSNGFKIRATGGVGYLTSPYIYIAFAEAPFKYANAG